MPYGTVNANYVLKHRDVVPIIDVRPAGYYEEGHIPNALSVPLDEVRKEAGDHVAEMIARRIASLGVGKDDEAIVYCQDGGYAAEASRMLAEQGYTNIRCYAGGFQDWNYDVQNSTEEERRRAGTKPPTRVRNAG